MSAGGLASVRSNRKKIRGKAGFIGKALPCAFLVFAIALADAGCLNGRSKRSALLSAEDPESPIGPGDPGDPGSVLQIAQALRSARDPNNLLDIIAKADGVIGRYCTPVSDPSAESKATCNCSFTYNVKNASGAIVSRETFESPTLYSESNLLRCSRAKIPPHVDKFAVRLLVTSPEKFYSNSIVVTIGSGAPIDLAEPSSYVSPNRYLCKDVVSVNYLFDGPGKNKFYDPFQSEDESVSYPLDFYTSNFGGDLSFFASKRISSWVCPTRPTDSDSQGRKLRIYSVAADNGSYLIYPHSKGFDRSKFFLARSSAGIFTVPVNAYVAPQIMTNSSASDAPPPLGYAVAPTRQGDTEYCPSTLPSSFKWAKLWLFRADAPTGKILYSDRIRKLGAISCNPGLWDDKDSNGREYGPFADCNVDPDGSGPLPPTSKGGEKGGNGRLADRILSNPGENAPVCVRVDNPVRGAFVCGNGSDPNTGLPNSGAGCARGSEANPRLNLDFVGRGSDVWQRREGKYRCTRTLANEPSVTDQVDLCNGSVPFDGKPEEVPLPDQTRYDFLFVVTPPEVMLKDMAGPNSDLKLKYTPFRFFSASDCESEDPSQCNSQEQRARRLNYGLLDHDIGSDEDRLFWPLCVLQPN